MKKVKLTLTVVPHALGELLEYIETTSGISADDMSMINPPSNGVIIPPSNKLGTCLPKHHQDPRLVMKFVRTEKSPGGYEVIDADASLSKLGLTRKCLMNTVCKAGTAENSIKHALSKQSERSKAA